MIEWISIEDRVPNAYQRVRVRFHEIAGLREVVGMWEGRPGRFVHDDGEAIVSVPLWAVTHWQEITESDDIQQTGDKT